MIVITSGIAHITNMSTMGCSNLLTYINGRLFGHWKLCLLCFTRADSTFCPYIFSLANEMELIRFRFNTF